MALVCAGLVGLVLEGAGLLLPGFLVSGDGIGVGLMAARCGTTAECCCGGVARPDLGALLVQTAEPSKTTGLSDTAGWIGLECGERLQPDTEG